MIMESVQQFGTRWSHIVKLMPGRTDNAIKNRHAVLPSLVVASRAPMQTGHVHVQVQLSDAARKAAPAPA